ncbi:MAG: hypothetical protein CMH03_06115 [Marinovum sp.]|nr:hypothetical protein [Marinovum sp.]
MVDDVQIPKINKVVKGRVVKGQIGYGINLEEMLWLTASTLPRSCSNENPAKINVGHVSGSFWWWENASID